MQLIVVLRGVLQFLIVVLVFDGMVESVKDGDTVTVKSGSGDEIVCRLHAIDAPERAQPFGPEASEALREMVEGRDVSVGLTGERTYGREVCVIEADGRSVNAEMVKIGMAWAARPYIKGDEDRRLYVGAEDYARGKGLGLWNSPGQISPWEWRRGKRQPEPVSRPGRVAEATGTHPTPE